MNAHRHYLNKKNPVMPAPAPNDKDIYMSYSGGNGGPPMDEWRNKTDARLDKIEQRLDTIEATVNRTETRMDSLDSRMDSLKKWTVSTILGGFALIICILSLFTVWSIHDSNRNWDRTQQTLDKIHAIELRMERNNPSK